MPAARSSRVNGCGRRLSHTAQGRRCGQRVGEFLRQRRIGARQDAVVGRLEGDAALRELPLDVLVAVDAQPRRVREVRAELHEARPEVVVDKVEVVVVHHRRRVRELHVAAPGGLVRPRLRAHHPRLLLRLAAVRATVMARTPVDGLPAGQTTATVATMRPETAASCRRGAAAGVRSTPPAPWSV